MTSRIRSTCARLSACDPVLAGNVAAGRAAANAGRCEQASGARDDVIDRPDVVEPVFAHSLVKVDTQEANIAAKYKKIIPDNKVTKILKEQNVKYETQEFKKKAIEVYE